MEQNAEYTILNRLYPKIEEALSEKRNVNNLINAIQNYADRHSNILLTTDMSQRLIFSDSDKKIVYTVTGISDKEVKEAVKDAPSIKSTWIKANNPFYILSVLIMHYFYTRKDKMSTSYGDAVTVYLGYMLYTTNHKATFPYAPNKQCMDYTINNLNNRFLIKQEGTIQRVIEHTVLSAISERLSTEVSRAMDDDINLIISSLDTRISSFITNIGNEFYKNHKANKYMFHEDEDLSEDNFHLSDNRSYKIDRVVQVVSSEIVSKGFDQVNCIKRAISLNPGVSDKKLDAMLKTIIELDSQTIPDIIGSILTLFLYRGVDNDINDVKTMKFLSQALQIYKSNAQDDVTYHIKDILLKWINLASEKYGRNFISRGKTSLDNYRRAIYTCFVLEIMECSK